MLIVHLASPFARQLAWLLASCVPGFSMSILYIGDNSIRMAGHTLIAKYAKTFMKCEKQKVFSEVFHVTFFAFCASFLHIAPRLAFVRKEKGFLKQNTKFEWNAKVYSECLVFYNVYPKNTRKIPAKYDKSIASLLDNTISKIIIIYDLYIGFSSL